ncbi:imidazole glycerol phosphate synthase subunit HisH [Candidatus Pelagibacter sp.]|jgi:glutamine amidotransferase|nr:imidazole glycerol phosphate synthase subunit HisH [Candidatus Pelagibacter sp.]
MSKIVIIDYSCGNIDSVQSAVNYNGHKSIVTRDYNIVANAEKIILPGQGSFKTGVKNLKNYGLFNLLKTKCLKEKIPILGICLGMQIFATTGYEDGKEEGLNLIPGKVEKMSSGDYKLPHIGWNQIKKLKEDVLLENIKDETDFYFVHSFVFNCENEENVLTKTNYKNSFVSSLSKENIYGVQFHPEKSLAPGLQIIKNFINL